MAHFRKLNLLLFCISPVAVAIGFSQSEGREPWWLAAALIFLIAALIAHPQVHGCSTSFRAPFAFFLTLNRHLPSLLIFGLTLLATFQCLPLDKTIVSTLSPLAADIYASWQDIAHDSLSFAEEKHGYSPSEFDQYPITLSVAPESTKTIAILLLGLSAIAYGAGRALTTAALVPATLGGITLMGLWVAGRNLCQHSSALRDWLSIEASLKNGDHSPGEIFVLLVLGTGGALGLIVYRLKSLKQEQYPRDAEESTEEKDDDPKDSGGVRIQIRHFSPVTIARGLSTRASNPGKADDWFPLRRIQSHQELLDLIPAVPSKEIYLGEIKRPELRRNPHQSGKVQQIQRAKSSLLSLFLKDRTSIFASLSFLVMGLSALFIADARGVLAVAISLLISVFVGSENKKKKAWVRNGILLLLLVFILAVSFVWWQPIPTIASLDAAPIQEQKGGNGLAEDPTNLRNAMRTSFLVGTGFGTFETIRPLFTKLQQDSSMQFLDSPMILLFMEGGLITLAILLGGVLITGKSLLKLIRSRDSMDLGLACLGGCTLISLLVGCIEKHGFFNLRAAFCMSLTWAAISIRGNRLETIDVRSSADSTPAKHLGRLPHFSFTAAPRCTSLFFLFLVCALIPLTYRQTVRDALVGTIKEELESRDISLSRLKKLDADLEQAEQQYGPDSELHLCRAHLQQELYATLTSSDRGESSKPMFVHDDNSHYVLQKIRRQCYSSVPLIWGTLSKPQIRQDRLLGEGAGFTQIPTSESARETRCSLMNSAVNEHLRIATVETCRALKRSPLSAAARVRLAQMDFLITDPRWTTRLLWQVSLLCGDSLADQLLVASMAWDMGNREMTTHALRRSLEIDLRRLPTVMQLIASFGGAFAPHEVIPPDKTATFLVVDWQLRRRSRKLDPVLRERALHYLNPPQTPFELELRERLQAEGR